MSHTAIVIGAGLGGLTTAAYLARAGWTVDVYEKNSTPGGRCQTMVREGFRFDVGASLFLMPELFRTVFAELGEDFDRMVELLPIDPSSELHFADGSRLKMTADLRRFKEELDRFEPGAFGGALEYLAFGSSCYDLALEALIKKDFRSLRDFLTPANILLFLKIKALSGHYREVSRHFKDERLRAAFSYYDLYVGLNPERAPAMYAMLPAMELVEGLAYPRGGMGRISDALAAIASKNGARFHYDCPVERILTQGGRARAVLSAEGERSAEVIIGNADAPYVYAELLGEPLKRRLSYSCSAYTFYWGLSRRLDEISEQHNIFVSKDYRRELRAVFDRNGASSEPHFYANFPSRSERAAAPEGKDSAMIIVPCGHRARGDRDFASERAAAREWVLAALSRRCGMEVGGLIEFELALTPVEWEETINLKGGAVFGSLDHSLLQMGLFRLPNRHPRYRNLYFAGGSSLPGSGVPMVLQGAKLASLRILEDAAGGV